VLQVQFIVMKNKGMLGAQMLCLAFCSLLARQENTKIKIKTPVLIKMYKRLAIYNNSIYWIPLQILHEVNFVLKKRFFNTIKFS